MRIYCTACDHKGRISSREETTRAYAKLYCQCLNAECGHTWVSELTFKHTLRAPAQRQTTLLLDHIRSLPSDRQHELFQQLGISPAA
ncbi:ogr/Delta-like zinc finger family protein [Pseudomonas sp. SWRI51]|uniref:ogr/Delta-like zinc finger family protein n=1 Tax=Pseudomonas sp. SWRI51 TaxID=2745491 RepID=UPI00164786FC|nr:ogr/Delta-like zinc finger family protein [Pseudomonas sp. SWRI51]MBC3410074.1 ogr/Delta-like zinc finger family protein [Pseudomonas sp. SWRI51]